MRYLKRLYEFMLTQKNGMEIMVCPECDGKGYTEKGKCKICKGSGELKFEKEDSDDEKSDKK